MFLLCDVCWPASLMYFDRSVAILTIVIGFVIEAYFVRRIYTKNWRESLLIAFYMNFCSAGLGLGIIPFTMMFDPIGLLSASFINTCIETLVLQYGCSLPMSKKIFGWIFLANFISVGISMLSYFFPLKDAR